MGFGLYVHFPFCRSKCRYCDFFSTTAAVPHEDYARAIERECRLRQAQWADRTARSLYLGGGTPTLWNARPMARAMAAIRALVDFAPLAEWTIEANPGTVDAARLMDCRAAGFDRLSLGVQSFDGAQLRRLGRAHSAQEAVQAANAARAAGFDNLSLDLIYGLPGQTLEGVGADLSAALALVPEHLSAYELMVEHLEMATPLARDVARGAVALPDEDEVFEMGRAVVDRAGAAGLTRYEISNFTRAGRASRHNQLYWSGGEYLGLGCGAVGFALDDPAHPERGGRRWSNHRDLGRYFAALEREELPEASSEALDAATLFEECLILGLRRCSGVDLEHAAQRLAMPAAQVEAIWVRAEPLIDAGWLSSEGQRLYLTRAGLDLHSEIAVRLLG